MESKGPSLEWELGQHEEGQDETPRRGLAAACAYSAPALLEGRGGHHCVAGPGGCQLARAGLGRFPHKPGSLACLQKQICSLSCRLPS